MSMQVYVFYLLLLCSFVNYEYFFFHQKVKLRQLIVLSDLGLSNSLNFDRRLTEFNRVSAHKYNILA